MMKKDKSLFVTVLLWAFLGLAGGHRFYNGRIISGFLQLFTLGGFFVWWAIDLFLLSGMVKGEFVPQQQSVNVTVNNVVNGNDNDKEWEATEQK